MTKWEAETGLFFQRSLPLNYPPILSNECVTQPQETLLEEQFSQVSYCKKRDRFFFPDLTISLVQDPSPTLSQARHEHCSLFPFTCFPWEGLNSFMQRPLWKFSISNKVVLKQTFKESLCLKYFCKICPPVVF